MQKENSSHKAKFASHMHNVPQNAEICGKEVMDYHCSI
jgi:hypothetical protein